jgi:XTP/dITP diphosphohydrolase
VGGAGAAVERLVEIIAALRTHCPWMGELTHASLVQYLIEESYELVDALEALDAAGAAPESRRAGLENELRGELGDVLLQVVLHARLQQEQGSFGLREVAEGLSAKMIRRNPHVFRPDGSLQDLPGGAGTEEILRTWQAVKQRESPGRSSPFEGIPRHLPALASAVQTLRRAGALDSGAGPAEAAEPPGPAELTEEALGEALFALARDGAHRGLDPERALRAAVRRFQAGFTAPG